MFSNSSVKYIQSLQQKKFRDELNCFVAEGPKVVEDLLGQNIFNCLGVYGTDEWYPVPGLSDELHHVISAHELERISGMHRPNRVLAVFEKLPAFDFDPLNSITLVLDDLQDPGNVGTIIRTADWFGLRNIVCSPATAERYNPKVVQGSMASLGRVNMLYTDIKGWVGQYPHIKKYAASLEGISIREMEPVKEGILIIGNESSGIHPDILALADNQIKIPGAGGAESLNAAVAAAIILYSFTG